MQLLLLQRLALFRFLDAQEQRQQQSPPPPPSPSQPHPSVERRSQQQQQRRRLRPRRERPERRLRQPSCGRDQEAASADHLLRRRLHLRGVVHVLLRRVLLARGRRCLDQQPPPLPDAAAAAVAVQLGALAPRPRFHQRVGPAAPHPPAQGADDEAECDSATAVTSSRGRPSAPAAVTAAVGTIGDGGDFAARANRAALLLHRSQLSGNKDVRNVKVQEKGLKSGDLTGFYVTVLCTMTLTL